MLGLLLTLALPDTPGCFEAAQAIPAGAPIGAEDVVAVACDRDKPAAGLRYDRSAATAVPRAPVPAGGYLGRLSGLPLGRVAKGERLTLRSAAGPVVIEREVTALQAGRSGQRIFVRDASGAVFAAALQLTADNAQ